MENTAPSSENRGSWASTAARIVAFVAYFLRSLEPIFKEKFPRTRRRRQSEDDFTLPYFISPDGGNVVMSVVGAEGPGGFHVEGDPFGFYLGGGSPALWFWCEHDATVHPSEKTNILDSFSWYYYAEDATGTECETVRWMVDEMGTVRRRGFVEEASVGTPVFVGSKSMDNIEDECRRILDVLKGPHILARGRSRRHK